ncbi:hypothetical protein DITRI_Ditri02bG0068800 [Diplodiscus trichospermus]
MDLASPKYFQASPLYPSKGEPPPETNASFYGQSKNNPFVDAFPDPLCKLNLKETSEFVKTFPMAASNNNKAGRGGFLDVSIQRERVNSITTQRRVFEAPSTPDRPVFSFGGGNLARKSFPSKWDDAEKWLISSSCHESPAHPIKAPPESSKMTKQCDNFKQATDIFAEKSRVTEERVEKLVTSLTGITGSKDVLLKGRDLTAFQL